jgi:hypothetical protein
VIPLAEPDLAEEIAHKRHVQQVLQTLGSGEPVVVKIHDHVTVGLARREVPGAMMVKALDGQAWPDGDVDLLGHLF